MKDIDVALKDLSMKQIPYQTLFDYFEGRAPIMYSTQQIRDVFKKIDVNFSLNWCAIVVNSVKDKMHLAHVDVPGTNLAEMLERNQLYLESDAVHEAMLVAGESFYIVWPDADGNAAGYFNDPRQCSVFYSPENPHKVNYAAKWFLDQDNHIRLTMYYDDRLEYYKSTSENLLGSSLTGNGFEPFVPEGADSATPTNPLGEVPVFHFRTSQRKVVSDLQNTIGPQNAINKLLSDMMVTAEFAAFKQKYIISNAEFEDGKLRSSPDEVWQIPDLDAKVGEFGVTELSNYIAALQHYASSLAIVERIPRYYLIQESGVPSGESLIAQESPLNKKVKDRIDNVIPVWKNVVRLMQKIETGKDLKVADINVVFDDPRTQTPLTDATIFQTRTGSGLTPAQAMKMDGSTDEEIKAILGEQGDRSAVKPTFVAPPTGKDSVPAK
jgi:hypothetical protein